VNVFASGAALPLRAAKRFMKKTFVAPDD